MRNNVAFEDDFLKGSGYALEIPTKIFNKNPNKNRNQLPHFILHFSFFPFPFSRNSMNASTSSS